MHGVVPDEARLYDYIARRFLASVGDDCVYESTELTIQCGADGSEHFSCHGLRVLDDGFTEIMPGARPQEKAIPEEVRSNVVTIIVSLAVNTC